MKKPLVFLACSLAVNAALLVTFFARPAARESTGGRPAIGKPTSTGFLVNSDPDLSPADAGALKRTGELIATGDLRPLVARLRAAGFPPSVIRGIITAQVADQFGTRRKAAVAHQEVIPYWRASQGSFPYDPKAGGEIARLGREQALLLRELLGPDSAASDDWSRLVQERKYGALSQAKIDRLQDIAADYNDLRSQFAAETRGVFLPEDQAKFQLLQQEQRADIVKLFTPEELAEYDMRTSMLGNRLRSQLATFNASEDEFRAIFQLTQAMEMQNGSNEFGPAGNVTRDRASDPKQLLAAITAALGPERAAEYQQAMNPNFQVVSRLLTRFELPASLAPRVISVQQDIEQQANALRQNQALSAADRNDRLGALALEAKDELISTLGVQAFEAYRASSGGWLNSLPPPVPPRK